MEDVLDRQSYDALLAAMPDRRFYHDLKHRDAVRKDGTSTRLRMYLYPELLARLPAEQKRMWMPIARALCSRQLELAFKRKFRRALEERFGKPAEKIGVTRSRSCFGTSRAIASASTATSRRRR